MKSNIAVIGQSGSVGVTLSEKLQAHSMFCDSTYDHGVESWSKLSLNAQAYRDAIQAIVENAKLVVLCVSDQVAKQIVSIVDALVSDTKIIDCSTAHRIDESWAYGLPELAEQREIIQSSTRVANPGCHATAVNLTLAPLKHLGLENVYCQSTTGYSGGGKAMIEQYKSGEGKPLAYSVGEPHKHEPEIEKYSEIKPVFQPMVIPVSQGILCSTFIPGVSASEVKLIYDSAYEGEGFVNVVSGSEPAIDLTANNGTNTTTLYIIDHEEGTQVITVLDNLGKGSAGAVVQNANLMLGMSERFGLK